MNKNILGIMLFLVMLLFTINLAFAAEVLTINIPAASATLSTNNTYINATGRGFFNATADLYNVSYYLRSLPSSNNNLSAGVLLFTNNGTANLNLLLQNVNLTADRECVAGCQMTQNFSSMNFQDGYNYEINMTITNMTGYRWSTVNQYIKINNGVPTAPSSCTNKNFENTTFSLACTVTDKDTTNVTIVWDYGAPNFPPPTIATYANGDGRAYYVVTSATAGTFSYHFVASDGIDTTNSVTNFISVRRTITTNEGIEATEAGAPTLSLIQAQFPQISQEITSPELTKTGIGAGIGAVVGFVFPVPGGTLVGAIIGGIIGAII